MAQKVIQIKDGSDNLFPTFPGIGERKYNLWNNTDSVLLIADKFNGTTFRISATSSSYPASLPTELQATTTILFRQQFTQYENALNHVIVILYEIFPVGRRIWINHYNTSWGGWKAITEQCQNSANVKLDNIRTTITPTTGSNYSTYGNSWYYKVGTRVHVHIGVQGLTANTNVSIGTMPTGYRPYAQTCAVGLANAIASTANLLIQSNGAISVYSSSTYACVDMEYDAF